MTAATYFPNQKFPRKLNHRESKVIETARLGYATLVLPAGQIFVGSAGNVTTAVTPTGDVTIGNTGITAIGASKVLLAMLAAGVKPSHIIKFVRTGSTNATLTGVAVGDLEIRIALAGTVTVVPAASSNTLGSAPLATDYSIVIRAAA